MDPQATWDLIVSNLEEINAHPDDGYSESRSEAVAALRDLADWLERAGFPPRV